MALTQVASGLIASVSGASLTGTQNIPKATLPTGSVLQVVSFSNGTQLATSSTSWVATSLTASITPTSSTSKILIMALGGTIDNNPGTNSQCYLSIFRNSATNLGNTNYGIVETYTSGSTRIQVNGTLGYLDSPATTSATTYTVYMRTNAASTCYYNVDGTISTMVLQEISA
jgi:hypothetical protein